MYGKFVKNLIDDWQKSQPVGCYVPVENSTIYEYFPQDIIKKIDSISQLPAIVVTPPVAGNVNAGAALGRHQFFCDLYFLFRNDVDEQYFQSLIYFLKNYSRMAIRNFSVEKVNNLLTFTAACYRVSLQAEALSPVPVFH